MVVKELIIDYNVIKLKVRGMGDTLLAFTFLLQFSRF